MTTRNQNFKVYRANSLLLSVPLTMADGSPYDPSIDVEMKWRLTRTSASPEEEALSRKEIGSGITKVTGGIEIALNPEDTDFEPGIYYHELKIWDTGDVDSSMTGFAIIRSSAQMGSNLSPTTKQIRLSGTAPTRAP
jgi:hypothetical protein